MKKLHRGETLGRKDTKKIKDLLKESKSDLVSRPCEEKEEAIAISFLLKISLAMTENNYTSRQMLEDKLYDYKLQNNDGSDIEIILKNDLYQIIHDKLNQISMTEDEKEKLFKRFGHTYDGFNFFKFSDLESYFHVLNLNSLYSYKFKGKKLHALDRKTCRLINRLRVYLNENYEGNFSNMIQELRS